MTDKQQPDPLALADEAWNFDCSKYRGARHANAAMMGKMQDCADMIRKLHAELERLALYKSLADEYGLSIFPDIAEMTAELETLRAKLKTYEDLGGAGSDVQLLRMGYAAARLEIESLRAAQPAGAQQPGAAYAALSDAEIDRIVPALEPVSEDFPVEWALWKDRGRIRNELRTSHGQAPAQPVATAGGSLARIIEEKIAAMTPSEASAFMAARAELAASGNDQAAPDMRDPYGGAREDLAIWRKRALEAEALNRKFATSVNGPTFMGEPAYSDGALMAREIHESQDDSLLLCASDLQHSAIYDNHVEMQSCMRAVAARIAALVHAAPKAEPAAPAAMAGSSEFPHEKMDAVALGRYKVVSSDQSMFYRFAVVAGDGAQQLYIGREVDCQNMARKFAGAFLDGAFAYHSMTAAPTTQPAPQQEPSCTSVQLAEMVLSDCGHSSNYTPLLDRVAARIDAHVERCLESKKTPQQEPFAWHVCSVNSDGSLSLEHAAAWEEAAHDHINDAITELDIEGAGSWVVRPAYHAPQTSPAAQADSVLEDAARYRLVRRGQHWSVIDGIGNALRAEELDAAVDAARAAQEGKSNG